MDAAAEASGSGDNKWWLPGSAVHHLQINKLVDMVLLMRWCLSRCRVGMVALGGGWIALVVVQCLFVC